jgi:SAM-dependent methyltransferase
MDYGPGQERPKSPLRLAARRLLGSLGSIFPTPYYALRYQVAKRQAHAAYAAEKGKWRAAFFEEANAPGRHCLQIGVLEGAGAKFGANWVSVDKYDRRQFIDYHDDINALHFSDDTFDALYCSAILEHVPQPTVAIAEFLRVLKPGGAVWIEVPMTYPYHEAPKDYWRVTPDGMRLWMAKFEEVGCGIRYWARSPLVCGTYYLGRKPGTPSSE